MSLLNDAALRIHPVIPSNAREATKDTTLPRGGGADGSSPLFVRRGTIVVYSVHSMHRDASVFGEDVYSFRPERWDGLRAGWAYLPFNGGPRICLGRNMPSSPQAGDEWQGDADAHQKSSLPSSRPSIRRREWCRHFRR